MFSLLAPKENRRAVAFLEHFRTSLYPWTLVATKNGKAGAVSTFMPELHGAASAWIAKANKGGRNVMALIAETKGAVTGVQLVQGHIRGTRHFAVRLHRKDAAEIEAFRPAPFLRLDAGARTFAVWRLINEVPIERAETVARAVAAQLGGVNAGWLVPVAGTTYEGAPVELAYLYKDRVNVLTDFTQISSSTASQGKPLFMRASEIKPQPLPWLWRPVVLRRQLSIISGEGGLGKSTIAAKIAATVTVGGKFPGGATTEVGSVIFCEGEDDVETVTIPRLQAAGANLDRLVIGPVCDLSQGVDTLEEVARAMDEFPSLVVLSPLRSFFGKESYVETIVRARIAPLLAWATTNDVAIFGVSHPAEGKESIGGSKVWTNAARAGLFAKRDERDPEARYVKPLKVNNGPDNWRLPYAIEAVSHSADIETTRIVWLADDLTASPKPKPKADDAPCPAIEGCVIPSITEPPRSDKSPRKPKAADWLRSALAAGPRDAVELKAEALQAGYSNGTLYRAAERIGVVIDGGGFGEAKIWQL